MANIGNKAVNVDALKYVKDTIDLSKAGYLEIQNGILNLYTDNTKKKKLASTTIPEVGSGGASINLSDYYTKLEIDANKTSKRRIDFDGTSFKLNGFTLNYKQLYDYHIATPDFAFVVYGDRAYLLSYVQDGTGMKEMRFQSVIAVTDSAGISNVKTSGIYVTSSDGVNIASARIVDINGENKAYKATSITDANKNDVWYPTTKAVADYVAANSTTKEDLESLREEMNTGGSGSGITPEDADLLKEVLYMNEYSTVERALEAKGKIDVLIMHLKAANVVSISASYTGGSVREGTSVSDLVGLVVRAIFSDDSEEVVDTYTLSPSTISVGSNTITVTYNGKKTTFVVTGIAKTVASLSAVYNGQNVVEGTSAEDLREDIVVTATYDDGTSAVVSGWTISGTVVVGTNDFVIAYGGKTTTVTVVGTQKPRTDIKGEPAFGENVSIAKNKQYEFYNTGSGNSTYIIPVQAGKHYRLVWKTSGAYTKPYLDNVFDATVANLTANCWLVCTTSDMKDATTTRKTASFENPTSIETVMVSQKLDDGMYYIELDISWAVNGWFGFSPQPLDGFYIYEV